MHKRLLITLFFSLFTFSLFSQHVTVQVADSTHVQDSLRNVVGKGQQGMNSLSQKGDVAGGNVRSLNSLYADSLPSLDDRLPVKRVYSEKYLKTFYDSISRVTGGKFPADLVKKKEMSREDLLKVINDKFPHARDVRTVVSGEQVAGLTDEDKLTSEVWELSSVSNILELKLQAEDLGELSPLPGSLVKSKYLKGLDSIRKINLEEERLKLKEERISSRSKLTEVKAKPSFMQRSYFEGVLGVMRGKDFTIYQASPAVGYYFTDYFSIGLGPTIQLQSSDKKVYGYAGIRTFSKIEFLKKQLYLQVEDAMNPYDGKNEKIKLDRHNVYVGGGVLLSVRAPLTLNFSVLYKVNESKVSVGDLSPLVFRVGISSIKIEK